MTNKFNQAQSTIKLTAAWKPILSKYYDYCSLSEYAKRLGIEFSDVNLVVTDLEQSTPYGTVLGVYDAKPGYGVSGWWFDTLWVMQDVNGKVRLGAALGLNPVKFRIATPRKVQKVYDKVFGSPIE